MSGSLNGGPRGGANHLHEPALRYARHDFPIIRNSLTVGEALNVIRSEGVGERIIYFYIVNDQGQLTGIVPTRRLLISMMNRPITDIMITDIVKISHRATVQQACEMFVNHKLFAFPIVDDDNRLQGVIDIGFFSDEQISVLERQKIEDIFKLIGVGIEQVRGHSVLHALRYRFPWLLALLVSGILCAIIASFYQTTLVENIFIVFFFILLLGLSESVSTQATTLALQSLHFGNPSWSSYLNQLGREFVTATLLGSTCGFLTAGVGWLWSGDPTLSIAIGLGVLLSVVIAGLLGLTVPIALYTIRKDSKIAIGPITLAVTDIAVVLLYLNVARLLLGS